MELKEVHLHINCIQWTQQSHYKTKIVDIVRICKEAVTACVKIVYCMRVRILRRNTKQNNQ